MKEKVKDDSKEGGIKTRNVKEKIEERTPEMAKKGEEGYDRR